MVTGKVVTKEGARDLTAADREYWAAQTARIIALRK